MTTNAKLTKTQLKIIAKDALAEGRVMDAVKLLTDRYDGRTHFNLEGALVEIAPAPKAKVGDILYTSWGYEQTNVDFYEVVRVSGKAVYVAKLGKRDHDERHVVAIPGAIVGRETRHTIGKHYTGVGYTLVIENDRTAWLWDGEPKYETPFGYGH